MEVNIASDGLWVFFVGQRCKACLEFSGSMFVVFVFYGVVFKRVSKSQQALMLRFCFTVHSIGRETPATFLTNHMPNYNQSWLCRTRFPALNTGCMYLLRVLIGSLSCFCLLWLASVYYSRLKTVQPLVCSDVIFLFVIPVVSEWGDIIDEMSDRMANQPSLIRKFAKER